MYYAQLREVAQKIDGSEIINVMLKVIIDIRDKYIPTNSLKFRLKQNL